LNIENRGGPAFVVSINGIEVTRAACDVGAGPLVPGHAGVPDLPWDLAVTRQGKVGRKLRRFVKAADYPPT
jgi:hypothetical protein